jgi:hypothetical protein
MILGLTLATAGPLPAATFTRTPIAPDLGLDALTRNVAREQLGRDLFANPYATVTISNTDLYDKFPYVETRSFEVVSDPKWNRIVYGERGRSLLAFDGHGTTIGALQGPRGMAVDERDRVYVADTGNDRIVVFQAVTEFGTIELVPLFTITGLAKPWDVAYSDGGTPFVDGDDLLYVADTGHNQVAAFALEAQGARPVASLGALGSGTDHFAGPMAVTVGHDESGSTRDVYVADAHNRRIVRLRNDGDHLTWVGEASNPADLVTSLDSDAWGNVYATEPRSSVVRKYSPDLQPVAAIDGGLASPHGFHLPFVNVRDHRTGTQSRIGQPQALSVEAWDASTGIAMWSLGLELRDLTVEHPEDPVASFSLTDRAKVAIDLLNVNTGATLVHRVTEPLAAGAHTLPLGADLRSVQVAPADVRVRLTALSSYPDGPSATAEVALVGGTPVTGHAVLIGNSPNPAAPFTRISFVVPSSAAPSALVVFDAGGRRIRGLGDGFGAGLHEVAWDGTDDRGRAVKAGVYFYRLEAGGARFTRRLVLVR